ncbi:hypothetical protein MF672_023910 [Actinomadura sp. ATCC 31491]|uniref:Secreted protein n=1 Tax=Actinomadura luzonensis TaxID=2805427 RepID=A0ABT0FWU0_9ACTN|nr:hypothetical protein [Actinomadura luzonensis]MCK2216815.1 hypothetical protein [Actinomadura luzonensis]
MRITGLTKIIAAAALATAAGTAAAAPAWAVEPRTEEFQNSTGIGAGTSGYAMQKCPSTLPYLVGYGASTKIDSDADELHTHIVKFSVNEANRTATVFFTNSQPKTEQHPVDVSVTIHITCSNVKPAQPPSPYVAKDVTVPILGAFETFVLCPGDHPRLVETQEGHDPALTRTKLRSFPGDVGGGATWENNDAFAPHPAWVRVYCTA